MTGQFATARRGMESIDFGFVMSRLQRGDPMASVARMAGVSQADVQRLVDTLSPRKPAEPVLATVLTLPGTQTPKAWRQSLPRAARLAIEAVAEAHGMTYGDLTLPRQFRGTKAACAARHEAYHAVYDIRRPDGSRKFSLPQVGAWFGGRDHTTIHHGVQRHEERLAERAGAQ